MTKLKNPQYDCLCTISDTVYFDWKRAGFRAQGWPATLKDRQIEGMTAVDSVCAYFGDPWINPASGGLIGNGWISGELGVSKRQLHRELDCGSAGFIRQAGRFCASNVGSLDTYCEINRKAREGAWRHNSPFGHKT